MTPLDDLTFFQTVARAGSLTATARELGLSLSAVSKRLKQLEARLGVSLAARTTRRLTLTAEGERYLLRGVTILDALVELENSLVEHKELTGRLRINATFGFGRRHIAPLLSSFCELNPGVESWLELTNFPLNLSDHGFDVGVRVGEPPDSRLVAKRILANRRVLCASPAYIARMPVLKTPSDLNYHECLVIRENDSDFPVWRFERKEAGRAESVKINGRLASNDGEVITRMALDGHGVILRSWWDVHEHLQAGRLARLLPNWQGVRADFYVVYEQRAYIPARLRAWVDFLQQHLSGRVPDLPE